ncbi:outer membrane biogenesis protein BamB [Stieleria maiorica]|uniref:Outer membrane biogenesis protein BamB n=1 Tax=Stieleria maiorica TaxID=2795974 RepID=A0A5B9MFA4_9BACT|nr:PQQ-binding-like beta-propeller repeat protein [Stieleria maiorica]QEF99808.1 outer membrane biogenesis protein BamB [Stieleria maiorica]
MRVGLLFTMLVVGAICHAEDWPGWRGPRGDGTSHETDVPTEWDAASGKNIRWKTPIAGAGYSSPVLVGDSIFLTSCDQTTQARLLHCLDRANGTPKWTREVIAAPLEGMHKLNSHASGTPAADADHVYVTFFQTDDTSGKRGEPGEMVVASYDHRGNQQWLVTVGAFSSIHGYCTSPVLFENLLLVNGDHDGESYLAALDKTTGDLVWKTPRVHQTRSYVTPLLREIDGQMQAVMTGSKRVAGFDPRSGRRLWWIEGPTEQFVASMVYDDQNFYLTAGFPTYHVMSIRPGGVGDVTDTHVNWHVTAAQSYVPSPVVTGGLLFIADDRGIAHCFDTESGERLWRERLGRHFSASLVTAGGLVYFTTDDGETIVMKASREPVVVAENSLGESVFASPAISDGKLYLRTREHLYCIGNP